MKPTKQDLINSIDKQIDDVIAPDLKVLFCGINPGLYTAFTGFHFARPGNRFWKALYLSGFTPYQFDPSEQHKLLDLGYGITNFVSRTSATAAELSNDEILKGKEILVEKVKKFKPKYLAILGIGTYKVGFNKPKAIVGLQDDMIGETKVWILPNPSGLNAGFPLPKIVELLKELKSSTL